MTQAVELIHRINPTWKDGDGCCHRCVESVLKAVDDATHQTERLNAQTGFRDYFRYYLSKHQAERLNAQTGFRSYYRYVLTKRESVFWHHVNPELRKWKRTVIIEEAGAAADSAGFGAFVIFDVDETLLAQGA